MDIVYKKTWNSFFMQEKQKPYFKKLLNQIDELYKNEVVFPKKEDIFRLFSLIEVENIKVIIMGQDPYHNYDQADGIAFSCGVDKTPGSLKNIFKELNSDLNIDHSKSNNLVNWVLQGVFMMNTIWTVSAHKPNSHKNIGWEIFSVNLLEFLLSKNNDIIVCLWGNFSKSIYNSLKSKSNFVIESAHPSPLSWRLFKNSKPFSKINKLLLKINNLEIDWSL